MWWYAVGCGFAVVVCSIVYSFLPEKFDTSLVWNKCVLITGGSQGLGEQLAYTYAHLGANVVIAARGKEGLEKVIEKCKVIGRPDGIYNYIVADMRVGGTPERVIDEAVDIFGALDVLYLNHNTVGSINGWTGSERNLKDINTTFEVNTRPYIHLASRALPHLQATNGSIGVSLAKGNIAMLLPVVTSTGAIEWFFNCLGLELRLRKYEVSVTIAYMGHLDTDAGHTCMKTLVGYDDDKFGYADPKEAALAIVKGIAKKKKRIFFPFSAGVIAFLSDWAPGIHGMLIARLFSTKKNPWILHDE